MGTSDVRLHAHGVNGEEVGSGLRRNAETGINYWKMS